MSCGCKAEKGDKTPINSLNNDENQPKKNIIAEIIHYSVKLIGFGIGLLLLPILVLVIIHYMFKLIVLTKDIDIKPLFVSLAKFMKKVGEDNEIKDEDDDDDDDDVEWENIDPNDFEMVGVDEIKKK